MQPEEMLEKAVLLNSDEDHVAVVSLVAPALLAADGHLLGDAETTGALLCQLGEAEVGLGAQTAALALFEAAGPEMTLLGLWQWTDLLRDRGDELRAIMLLEGLPEANPRQLSDAYDDFGLPVLRHSALRRLPWPRRGERLGQAWLWWRIGGPVPFLRAARERRERVRLEAMGVDAAPATPVETGAVLRSIVANVERDRRAQAVVREAKALEEMAADAMRVLAKALREDAGHPLLLFWSGIAAEELGLSEAALAFYGRLAEQDRDYGGLVLRQLNLCREVGRRQSAWQLLGRLTGQSEDKRTARAEVFLDAGSRFAAALARGRASRFALDGRDWRALWWRTGGPLTFIRRRGAIRDSARRDDHRTATMSRIDPPDGEPADWMEQAASATQLVARADELAAKAGRDEAIAALTAAADAGEPDLKVLSELVDQLSSADRDEEALMRVRQARKRYPSRPDLVESELRLLGYLNRSYEALEVLRALPDEVCSTLGCRNTAADLYDQTGFTTLAVDAYGPAAGRIGWRRRYRQRLWWRTGGPLRRVRRRRFESERRALSSWQHRVAERARTLRGVVGAEHLDRLRTAADAHELEETALRLRWGRVAVVAHYAGGLVAWAIAVWLVGPSTPLPLSFAAAGVLVGHLVLHRAAGLGSDPGNRVFRRSLPTVAVAALGGYLIARLPGSGWPAIAGTLVVAAAGVAFGQIVVAFVTGLSRSLALRRFRRGDPRGVALTRLLDLLDRVSPRQWRNSMASRRSWVQELEGVALTLESDLPSTFGSVDAHTGQMLHVGSRQAAAALRELKYDVASGRPGGWKRVETVLRWDIKALATGELGRLATADPPPARPVHRTRRQVAFWLIRMLVFAGLPLTVVLVAQPWLRFNDAILNWARVLSVGWALLYVLLTADPTAFGKLRRFFALINFGRGGDLTELDRGERKDEEATR